MSNKLNKTFLQDFYFMLEDFSFDHLSSLLNWGTFWWIQSLRRDLNLHMLGLFLISSGSLFHCTLPRKQKLFMANESLELGTIIFSNLLSLPIILKKRYSMNCVIINNGLIWYIWNLKYKVISTNLIKQFHELRDYKYRT